MHCLYLFCLPDKLTLLLLCPFLSLVTKFVSKIFLPYTTVGRNINNLRYADDTTLMAESKEELKSILMKVKEENEKAGLKLSIQKTRIMASSPITSWQRDGETKQWQTLFSWAPKSLQMVTAAMKLKDSCSLEEKLWPT